MTDLLESYLRFTVPAAFAGEVSDTLAEELDEEKVLLTLATLAQPIRVTGATQSRISQDIARIERLGSLAERIIAIANGRVHVIKGSRCADLYPRGTLRYQGDLDLLIDDEPTYLDCLRQLLASGFTQIASHLTQARDGGLYASTKLFDPSDGHGPAPPSLMVELHLRGFPITPLSYLNMVPSSHDQLSPEGWGALTLFAEFVHRYAKFQRFTHRDVIDVLLTFSRLGAADARRLGEVISSNYLWVSVALFRRHLGELSWTEVPDSLATILADPRASTAPENYDPFELQAWPFRRGEGMTRQGYEFLHTAYGRINTPDGEVTQLTAFEIGMCFDRGVPVAIRLGESAVGASVLSACVVLAGPQAKRQIVHQRIGESSPIGPQ